MSTFAHRHHETSIELTVGLDERSGAKVSRLRLTNDGDRPRRLSVTAYVEWALGPEREHTQHQIRTEYDASRGAIFARNTFDPQFASWLAFCGMSPRPEQHTADRREFLGRNGTAADPAGLRNPALTGRTGAALDPCAALKRVVEWLPASRARWWWCSAPAPRGQRRRRRWTCSWTRLPPGPTWPRSPPGSSGSRWCG